MTRVQIRSGASDSVPNGTRDLAGHRYEVLKRPALIRDAGKLSDAKRSIVVNDPCISGACRQATCLARASKQGPLSSLYSPRQRALWMIFALYSPMFGCGTCPRPGSATSPSDARDAARPSLLRSEPCQTVGLLPLVRCVERGGATCRQRFSVAHYLPSFIMDSIAWWCANG